MTEYKYKVTDGVDGSCSVPPNSSFYLEYKKGKKVKAPKGSLGIMVFSTRERAISFLHGVLGWRDLSRIKRVVSAGTAKFPKRMSSIVNTRSIERFNQQIAQGQGFTSHGRHLPAGTVCYPEVFVVD